MSIYGNAPVAHYREGLESAKPAPETVPPGAMWFSKDTHTLYVSNGSTAWNALAPSIPTGRRVALWDGAGVRIDDAVEAHLNWVPDSSDPDNDPTLLDLTDPTAPLLTEEGLWAITATPRASSGWLAGSFAAVPFCEGTLLVTDSNAYGTTFDSGGYAPVATILTSGEWAWYTSGTIIAPLHAGAKLEMIVRNHAGRNGQFLLGATVTKVDNRIVSPPI